MTSRFESDGRRVSLLGYCAMRLPTIDGRHADDRSPEGYSRKRIDQDLLDAQVKRLLDGGVNYFDTSPVYCRGESESCLGRALAGSGYPRRSYAIATKLSNFADSSHTLDACREMFEKSLERLCTGYVDSYMLHSEGGGFDAFSERCLENGALDWCVELRKERRIRNLGFALDDDPEAFDWCLGHHGDYGWDFCQIRMNYVEWARAGRMNPRLPDARELYGRLADLGIPVVVSEPLLGGRLARYNTALALNLKPLDPSASLARWALRFAGSFPNVMTVLAGMTDFGEVRENLATFSPLETLSDSEFAALARAADAYIAGGPIPCTACGYCMPCPYGLDIPGIFRFRNGFFACAEEKPAGRVLAEYADAVPDPLRRADRCTGCGRCSAHCPQRIDIPHEMASFDGAMDEFARRAFVGDLGRRNRESSKWL